MAHKFSCKRCYETDDIGLIKRFLCSRYGWRKGYHACRCRHHEGDVSLYGEVLVARARDAA